MEKNRCATGRKAVILLVIATVTIMFMFSGCSSSGTQQSGGDDTVSESDLPGKYDNVGIMAIAGPQYDLHDNGTFDVYLSGVNNPITKGTYTVDSHSFRLTSKDYLNSVDGNYTKYGEYYYKDDPNFANFYKDDEYGIPISFNEEGRTEQTFESNHHSIGSESSGYSWYRVNLFLHEDGTCIVYKCIFYQNGKEDQKETFEGTYTLNENGDILTLNFDGTEHICLIVDEKIYYNVLKKVEE